MLHLKLQDGTLTTNPKEMRDQANNFYTDLFKARDTNCIEDLQQICQRSLMIRDDGLTLDYFER